MSQEECEWEARAWGEGRDLNECHGQTGSVNQSPFIRYQGEKEQSALIRPDTFHYVREHVSASLNVFPWRALWVGIVFYMCACMCVLCVCMCVMCRAYVRKGCVNRMLEMNELCILHHDQSWSLCCRRAVHVLVVLPFVPGNPVIKFRGLTCKINKLG